VSWYYIGIVEMCLVNSTATGMSHGWAAGTFFSTGGGGGGGLPVTCHH